MPKRARVNDIIMNIMTARMAIAIALSQLTSKIALKTANTAKIPNIKESKKYGVSIIKIMENTITLANVAITALPKETFLDIAPAAIHTGIEIITQLRKKTEGSIEHLLRVSYDS